MLLTRLAQQWWIIAVRGALALAFGVLALLRPGITLAVLVVLFGAYVLIDGGATLAAALRWRHERNRWLPLLAEGILELILGAVAILFPAAIAFAWVFTVAAWAIVTGVLELVAALHLRKHIADEIFLGLTGLTSILLGLAFVAFPLAGLVAWVWLLGAYAIVFGGLMIALALRLRGLSHDLQHLEQSMAA